MDIATIVGFTGGMGLLMLVMQMSGGLLMYWDLVSAVIVVGGSVFSVIMRWPLGSAIRGFSAMIFAIFNKVQDPFELIDEITELAKTARQESILALEKVSIGNRILAKAVNYMVDGYDPQVISDILNIELANMRQRHKDARGVVENMGEACPAFGMIGTVIGLIVIMANLTDPNKIGPGLAVALVTTLYGSLIANMVFIPMGQKLKFRSQEESTNIEIIMEGVKSILNGENPKSIRERLESFLAPQSGGEGK